ncbi:hypothetical protein ACFS5M_07255 [Lacinutrix iliipiscaria]|uniref:STAS/SEC14 domain-containing protein n=1 Tax=Lacinutrix iliipiscaria TaxID=1230532 RepID=A0ABW5WNN9_9FLAO
MGQTIDIDIGIGIATLHDYYMITVMHEGVTVSVDTSQVLIDFAKSHFKNKPFIYITHRKHSYAVDTAIYKETMKIKNLIGFAVVSTKGMAITNASIEKMFVNKPFEIFEELDEAILWAKKIYKLHQLKKKTN